MRCLLCGKEFVTSNRICPYCKSKNYSEGREEPVAPITTHQKIRSTNQVSATPPTEGTRPYIPPPPPDFPTQKPRPSTPLQINHHNNSFKSSAFVDGQKAQDKKILRLIAGCVVILAFLYIFVVMEMVAPDFLSGLGATGVDGELKIIESHMDTSYQTSRIVSGTIQNVGGKTIDYGMVTANLYDKYNNLVNSGFEPFGHLKPGETHYFSIMVIDLDASDITSYDLETTVY